jgi:hypothetical protein
LVLVAHPDCPVQMVQTLYLVQLLLQVAVVAVLAHPIKMVAMAALEEVRELFLEVELWEQA